MCVFLLEYIYSFSCCANENDIYTIDNNFFSVFDEYNNFFSVLDEFVVIVNENIVSYCMDIVMMMMIYTCSAYNCVIVGICENVWYCVKEWKMFSDFMET